MCFKTIGYLKKIQDIINETHHNRDNTFRAYCFEQFLCDQLNHKTKTTNSTLEKK
jgi:hypothetical protein